MTRVLVVDALKACNVPPEIRRRVPGMKLKLYVIATSEPAGGQLQHKTEVVDAEKGPGQPASAATWDQVQLRVRLPERQNESFVNFQLLQRRTGGIRDRVVASVRIDVADLISNMGAEATESATTTHEMSLGIELRITAHVEEDDYAQLPGERTRNPAPRNRRWVVSEGIDALNLGVSAASLAEQSRVDNEYDEEEEE